LREKFGVISFPWLLRRGTAAYLSGEIRD
jgi:hypothetical protein